ncbi:hypothetical protein AAC387_Pa12g0645 [Persea americana]
MEPSLPTKSPKPISPSPNAISSFLSSRSFSPKSIYSSSNPPFFFFIFPKSKPLFHLSISQSLHHPTTASSNPTLHSKPISPSTDLNEFINNFNRTLGKGQMCVDIARNTSPTNPTDPHPRAPLTSSQSSVRTTLEIGFEDDP